MGICEMRLRYHGIQYEDDNDTGCFRLGMMRLLHWLTTFDIPKAQKKSEQGDRPEWTQAWRNRRFSQATKKFQDAFWKLDRAASHFAQCVDTIKLHREPKSLEAAGRLQNALADTPLYLDSILFYLRIQADSLANAIPFFYETRPQIADRSFRDQVKWFRKKKPDFDPDYTAILETDLGWFDVLAGKSPKGLRDIVVHQRGVYQIGWRKPRELEDFEILVSLTSDARIVHDNVVSTLKSLVGSYFIYLDKTYAHFVDYLRSEVGGESIPAGESPTQYYHFSEHGFLIKPRLAK
jgi:hypothetical protein